MSDSETDAEESAVEAAITSVDLGLIEEEPDEDAFLPFNFPCKVGGKPVWLDPRAVLGAEDAKCEVCSGTMVLLTQIYCPLPNREDAYHRTIYVFVCPKRECCSKNNSNNFAVFRSQLAEHNPVYPLDNVTKAEKLNSENAYAETLPQLCVVCGIEAPSRCARCKIASYCSRLHQTHHWHNGGHKQACKGEQIESDSASSNAAMSVLLPEYELYIEPEPAQDEKDDLLDKADDTLNDLNSFTKEQTEYEDGDKNLEKQITTNKDPAFSRFLRRIKRCPSQVIRYDLGSAQPLWPSTSNRPESIPNCSLCGARRQFELQIMPQMLTYLLVENTVVGNCIDWATLAIYTCSANCQTEIERKPICAKEYLWKQDYTQ